MDLTNKKTARDEFIKKVFGDSKNNNLRFSDDSLSSNLSAIKTGVTASGTASDITSPINPLLQDIYDSGKEPNTDYLGIIPIDKTNYPRYRETFYNKINNNAIRGETKNEEGKKIITYTTPVKGGELTYRFYEDIITKELGIDATKKIPSLGRRASRLWLSMIFFAKKQGKNLEGNFTASEMMKLWNIKPDKRGGNSWSDIRETFFNVVAVSPSFTNKRSGDERTDWGFSFASSYLIKGEGREARYHYTMTPEALGLTEKWLRGELTIEEIKTTGGYLAYPLTYLQGSLDETEHNFREYLLRYEGGYTIKLYTIAKDWLKLRNDLLRRPKYCHEIIVKYLNNAKDRGEISSYTLEVKSFNDWRNKWKVTIYKPKLKTKAIVSKKENDQVYTQEEEAIINKVFKWQMKPIHGIKTPPEELKQMIANTVKCYGVKTISRLLERANNTFHFWNEVKKLKANKKQQN